MYTIIKANIERFKLLLRTETDQTKRAMEIRLLAEEEAKLPRSKKETSDIDSGTVKRSADHGRLVPPTTIRRLASLLAGAANVSEAAARLAA
jgi:hypothetical protein